MEKILSYVTAGTVTAVLSVAAIVAGAFGKTALATFFNDPSTPQTILTVVGSLGTLVSGFLNGVKPKVVEVPVVVPVEVPPAS